MDILNFQKLVWSFYKKNKRTLPWRIRTDPYAIVVSEVMLQQTQVSRIKNKFPEFLSKFPDWSSLASAQLKDVLTVWNGIGYNRRALYLKKIAEIVHGKYHGALPENPEILDTFPGIGKATAGSITAFAFNKPTVFIETNIRRIFIHHFFHDRENIDDKEIMPLIEETLDKENPREWYWALLDYGTYLAKTIDNPNRRSKHYSIQSKFEGSIRQVRSNILKIIMQKGQLDKNDINRLSFNKTRVLRALRSLVKDNLINQKNGKYSI